MQRRTETPWERQQGESEKAYWAFAIYRDMGEKRTIAAVVNQLQKSRSLIDRWKDRWDWVERVRAYDNYLDKEARATAIKERKQMTERHIIIAKQIQAKALEALADLDTDDMSPKDIKEFIKMATDLERLNRTLSETEERETTKEQTSLADTIIAAYEARRDRE